MTDLFLDRIWGKSRQADNHNGEPLVDRVCDFIRHVERQDYCDAIVRFYREDATAQDNQGPMRVGRDAVLAQLMDVVARFGRPSVQKVRNFAVNGDTVFINWVFEVTRHDGSTALLDEVSMQVWDGERIISERFFYNPAQLTI